MLTALVHPSDDSAAFERKFAPECSSEEFEGYDIICPLCEEELMFVSEASDGTTAHFRHRVEPDHPRVSEGKTHRKAKMKFYNELKPEEDKDGLQTDWVRYVSNVQLEKVIRPEIEEFASDSLFERKYEIADLFFKYKNEKCVVEFQCSSQGWRQFKLRTMYYNLHGYKVLWILDRDLVTQDKKGRYICSSAFYNLSKMYDGRLYFFDSESENIFAGKFVNFSAKTRADKLSVNVLSDLTSFEFGVGGLGDTFRFADDLSYYELKDGKDLEDSPVLGCFTCPYCGKEYELEEYFKKHVRECSTEEVKNL